MKNQAQVKGTQVLVSHSCSLSEWSWTSFNTLKKKRCGLHSLQVLSSLGKSLILRTERPYSKSSVQQAERLLAVDLQTTYYKSTAHTCLSSKWAKKGIHFRKSNCIKELIPEKGLGLIVYWDGLSSATNDLAEKICTSTTQLHWLTASSQTAHGTS